MKVAVTYSNNRPVTERDFEVISEVLSDHTITGIEVSDGNGGIDTITDETLIEGLEGCQALIHRVGMISETVVESCHGLEIIALLSSGSDHIDIRAATEHGVVVTHNPEAHATSVSEGALNLIFEVTRMTSRQFSLTADGKWREGREFAQQRTIPLLANSTLGVVGLGTIGFKVGYRANAFGGDVIGYDPFVRDSYRAAIRESGIEIVDDLTDLFEQADLVTVHTPLTSSTRHMIGDEELVALADGYLVNTSRGGVIDEAALIDAVENDRLAGVALDVLEQEPPKEDNPLLYHPNVIVSPHTAGEGVRSEEHRASRLSAEKVSAYSNGGRPERLLNPSTLDE